MQARPGPRAIVAGTMRRVTCSFASIRDDAAEAEPRCVA